MKAEFDFDPKWYRGMRATDQVRQLEGANKLVHLLIDSIPQSTPKRKEAAFCRQVFNDPNLNGVNGGYHRQTREGIKK